MLVIGGMRSPDRRRGGRDRRFACSASLLRNLDGVSILASSPVPPLLWGSQIVLGVIFILIMIYPSERRHGRSLNCRSDGLPLCFTEAERKRTHETDQKERGGLAVDGRFSRSPPARFSSRLAAADDTIKDRAPFNVTGRNPR